MNRREWLRENSRIKKRRRRRENERKREYFLEREIREDKMSLLRGWKLNLLFIMIFKVTYVFFYISYIGFQNSSLECINIRWGHF